MEKPDKIDTKLTSILLNEDALHHINEMLKYIEILEELLKNLNTTNLDISLKIDITLQHAVIFVFKAIGVCIDKVLDSLELEVKKMPYFWAIMHYLRNALVHHLNAIVIPKQSLYLSLADICRNIEDIKKCFSKAINSKKTSNEQQTDDMQVFLYISEFSNALKTEFPREDRDKVEQNNYLKIISDATYIISELTKSSELSEAFVSKLENEKPKLYFALQNILELIATIANPNPKFRLLTQSTREKINKTYLEADNWLADLGDARGYAMHNSITIGNNTFYSHLKNMCLLRKEVLLNVEFCKDLNFDASPSPFLKHLTATPVSPVSISWASKFDSTPNKASTKNVPKILKVDTSTNTNRIPEKIQLTSEEQLPTKVEPKSNTKQRSPIAPATIAKGNNTNTTNFSPEKPQSFSIVSPPTTLFKSAPKKVSSPLPKAPKSNMKTLNSTEDDSALQTKNNSSFDLGRRSSKK